MASGVLPSYLESQYAQTRSQPACGPSLFHELALGQPRAPASEGDAVPLEQRCVRLSKPSLERAKAVDYDW